HLLKVLRDLGQVLGEQDSLHAAGVYFVDARRSARWAPTAASRAAAMNETATPAVMPCQYHSGYSRSRLLVAGSKRKLPWGKKTSWKSRNSGSKAKVAATPITATIPAATSEPARTRRRAVPRRRAREMRYATTK